MGMSHCSHQPSSHLVEARLDWVASRADNGWSSHERLSSQVDVGDSCSHQPSSHLMEASLYWMAS